VSLAPSRGQTQYANATLEAKCSGWLENYYANFASACNTYLKIVLCYVRP